MLKMEEPFNNYCQESEEMFCSSYFSVKPIISRVHGTEKHGGDAHIV